MYLHIYMIQFQVFLNGTLEGKTNIHPFFAYLIRLAYFLKNLPWPRFPKTKQCIFNTLKSRWNRRMLRQHTQSAQPKTSTGCGHRQNHLSFEATHWILPWRCLGLFSSFSPSIYKNSWIVLFLFIYLSFNFLAMVDRQFAFCWFFNIASFPTIW